MGPSVGHRFRRLGRTGSLENLLNPAELSQGVDFVGLEGTNQLSLLSLYIRGKKKPISQKLFFALFFVPPSLSKRRERSFSSLRLKKKSSKVTDCWPGENMTLKNERKKNLLLRWCSLMRMTCFFWLLLRRALGKRCWFWRMRRRSRKKTKAICEGRISLWRVAVLALSVWRKIWKKCGIILCLSLSYSCLVVA